MGGKRIAEQVRRALIAAAKVAPVAVAIDATGCSVYEEALCMAICHRDAYRDPVCPTSQWSAGGAGGHTPSTDGGPGFGSGGHSGSDASADAGSNARDASQDVPSKSDARHDAGKDGG